MTSELDLPVRRGIREKSRCPGCWGQDLGRRAAATIPPAPLDQDRTEKAVRREGSCSGGLHRHGGLARKWEEFRSGVGKAMARGSDSPKYMKGL